MNIVGWTAQDHHLFHHWMSDAINLFGFGKDFLKAVKSACGMTQAEFFSYLKMGGDPGVGLDFALDKAQPVRAFPSGFSLWTDLVNDYETDMEKNGGRDKTLTYGATRKDGNVYLVEPYYMAGLVMWYKLNNDRKATEADVWTKVGKPFIKKVYSKIRWR